MAARPSRLQLLTGGLRCGVGGIVGDAYRSGNVPLAAAVTLGVNLVLAALVQATLPTLVVPFLGVAITLVRGFTWGTLFTPVGAEDATYLVHGVTLAYEAVTVIHVIA